MKKMKRILAMLLCILMTCSGPLGVFAEEGTPAVIDEQQEEVQLECNCETTTEEHAETCPKYVKPEARKVCEICQKEVCVCDENKESTVQTLEEELPECNCQTTNEIHAESCPKYVDPEPPKVCETCQQEVCVCEQVENEPDEQKEGLEPIFTVAEQVLAAESIEEMYLVILDFMQNDPEALKALTAEEIESIRTRVNELDPEGDDVDTEDLLDTLSVLPNNGEKTEESLAPLGGIAKDETWQGSRFTSDSVQEFSKNVTVTMRKLTEEEIAKRQQNANFVIPNGVTVTFKGNGTFKRDSDNTLALIYVEEGGTLVIEGASKDNPLIIDGDKVIANNPLIVSHGTVELKNAVIQNGKNRSVYPEGHKNAGKPSGEGGGISIGSTGSLTMVNCVVTENTASLNGGGIISSGNVIIKNSEISYNRAMSSETGDGVVNAGRGGGFAFSGSTSVSILEDVTVTQNAAMYYGGGGQISGGASLTMEGKTNFSDNKALLHGAGGLHVTGDAIFTMNGGTITGNTAQTVGGGIHSSYSCTLNLNAGTISNNTANGRGGGVHVNTGGSITLGEGLTISGNKTNNEPTGSYAEVDPTGDEWSNIQKNGPHNNNGYGGGVLIDSGTCTVAGATITGNSAAVGGGGIALTMLNMSESGLDDIMVVGFTMTSGEISANETGGDGAGVYLMSNRAVDNLEKIYTDEDALKAAIEKINSQNRHIKNDADPDNPDRIYDNVEDILYGIPVATVSGGTIQGNTATANGGGLYLGENTRFIINGGEISANQAVNGAGVFVESGTAEIKGGTMTANQASDDGGALYIKGNVTMTNGSIGGNTEEMANTAVNGGAMYVSNGNVTIEHGTISGNKASGNGDDLQDTANDTGRGGAVYLAGDTETKLTMESGTMNNNQASNDGGAIFATGGTIKIGLESCSTETARDDCEHHTDDRHHPVINGNVAGDTGGGIALTEGAVWFYCGKANENKASYPGVGYNVFMNGGEFYLYNGADIGGSRDPGLVIVGGKLYNKCESKEYVKLYYYENNTKTLTNMEGSAEYGEIMNLPDGEYFWDAPEGYVFLGWTAQGAASGNQNNGFVRNKEQYVNSGEPVEILDQLSNGTDQTAINTDRVFDGKTDAGQKIMHLYALWAPETSEITYVNGLTGETIPNTETDPDNPAAYTFSRESNKIQIQPVEYPGYDLIGWYIYQDANQNANWNATLNDKKYEPAYLNNEGTSYNNLDYSKLKYLQLDRINSILELEAGYTNFGDITLIADYKLAYRDLKITKSGANKALDPDQTFIFKVTGDAYVDGTGREDNDNNSVDIEMEVVINGNGTIAIEHLPVGDYEVTELTGWSWRYAPDDIYVEEKLWEEKQPVSVKLNNSQEEKEVTFNNNRNNPYWMDGNSHVQNIFTERSVTRFLKKQEGGN